MAFIVLRQSQHAPQMHLWPPHTPPLSFLSPIVSISIIFACNCNTQYIYYMFRQSFEAQDVEHFLQSFEQFTQFAQSNSIQNCTLSRFRKISDENWPIPLIRSKIRRRWKSQKYKLWKGNKRVQLKWQQTIFKFAFWC